MKYLILIALSSLLFLSCSKEELTTETLFEYNSNQPTVINVEVIPTEDVTLNFAEMEYVVNSEYFHRYGIHLNLVESARIELDERITDGPQIFLPFDTDRDVVRNHIKVYVLSEDNINFWGSPSGYAMVDQLNVMVREDVQTERTVAHEIAHVLGLGHNDTKGNMMTEKVALGSSIVYDFTEEQVAIMMATIADRNLNTK
ncbi:matrixin family metalloprotease [Maribacter phage Colly_1]|uniref:Matrixin family metalloprotease n=1 Tax=Maribacter phage Colly_1 TaxID=2745691 RepID=A0A8E4XY18_9CAUD|nr:matrixin family metalloprotease [Maribacter phage Colly_1]QQO97377.1 matrixin family metalloprotease [Maribacter phage Colly_1]